MPTTVHLCLLTDSSADASLSTMVALPAIAVKSTMPNGSSVKAWSAVDDELWSFILYKVEMTLVVYTMSVLQQSWILLAGGDEQSADWNDFVHVSSL